MASKFGLRVTSRRSATDDCSKDDQQELQVYFYVNAELEAVEISHGGVTEYMRSRLGAEITQGAITWLGVYATPLNLTGRLLPMVYHALVVFTTGDEYWWSVEKHTHGIVLQRSKSQAYLLGHVGGKARTSDGKSADMMKQDHAYPGCTIGRVAQLLDLTNDVKRYNLFQENCKHFAKTFFDKMALSETW
eukprot:scpid93582/ scgid6289/ 